MFGTAGAIYLATRKKHDQLWNTYVMRPLAAGVVALLANTPITPNQLTLLNLFLFIDGVAWMVANPTRQGSLVAVVILELSYLFDCADGMLARHKKLASKTGHLFDFFTDESKETMLAGALALFLYRQGGFSFLPLPWAAQDPRFLLLGMVAIFVVASGLSLTNFVRRPELSGQETTVEAHYEANPEAKPQSPVRAVASLVLTFLRFVNHYPSHLWLWALVGRLDVYLVINTVLNGLYLVKGWLGLVLQEYPLDIDSRPIYYARQLMANLNDNSDEEIEDYTESEADYEDELLDFLTGGDLDNDDFDGDWDNLRSSRGLD